MLKKNSLSFTSFSIIVLLSLFLSFASCGSGSKSAQKTNTGNNSTVLSPKPNEPAVKIKQQEHPSGNSTANTNTTKAKVKDINLPSINEEVYMPDSKTTLDTTASLPVIPESFDIAVMLPFNTQYYFPNFNNDSIPDKSVLALEFYEGLQIGLDHLNRSGQSFNVHVFDTQNNTSKVSEILGKPFVQNADLIIGPVYNNSLKVVANFAKQNQIYHVSPLSPATDITYNNPYYLVANPSIETHCAAMYRYMMSNFGQKRIVALNSGKSSEIQLSNLFYKFSDFYRTKEGGQGYVNVSQSAVSTEEDEFALELLLSRTEENIIVITSFNELFINDVMRKLSLLRNRYRITLFGMPNWMKMQNLELEYLAKLNFHVSSHLWIDEYSSTHTAFKQDFYRRFYTKPSNYAISGYNLISFFGNALKTHGSNFGMHINRLNIPALYTNYQFEPASKRQYDSQIITTDYFENQFVNILRYTSDHRLEKAN